MRTFIRRIVLSLLLCGSARAFEAFDVTDIRVEGLERISPGTVFNYLPIKVGDTVDSADTVKASNLRQAHAWGF